MLIHRFAHHIYSSPGNPRRAFPNCPKISQFHAVFLENLAKLYVAPPPPRVGSPYHEESWIRRPPPWLIYFLNVHMVWLSVCACVFNAHISGMSKWRGTVCCHLMFWCTMRTPTTMNVRGWIPFMKQHCEKKDSCNLITGDFYQFEITSRYLADVLSTIQLWI